MSPADAGSAGGVLLLMPQPAPWGPDAVDSVPYRVVLVGSETRPSIDVDTEDRSSPG